MILNSESVRHSNGRPKSKKALMEGDALHHCQKPNDPQKPERVSDPKEAKMGDNDVEVIDVLSSTTKKTVLVDCDPEIRHIVCLKNADDLRRFEDTEDCFIVDYAPIDLSKLFDADDQNAPEFAVVYEKGQVACRDYPHPRHLCLEFPFATTAHKSHCNMCYCYVCDAPAPCSLWEGSHCDAWGGGDWETLRSGMRK